MVQQKKCLVLTHTVYERWTHPALPRWFMDAFSILAAVIILFFFFFRFLSVCLFLLNLILLYVFPVCLYPSLHHFLPFLCPGSDL